ncbi:putative pterin-4-alpha-carbinolamine dehydratase [Microstroma glucosiphilum]|uniref:4a-hydroxytetrahydrobiopterin dehydratase n=1 Tax=Pseudomicrostroma glucosiphilum TaxID=1684307 RepID=A0A316UGU2_9BASI|nr:putative pterin-4-alpha-carbinolamine dehydratase [Pseudomicrostroma glucosiphilum]PWN22395.1 putative pterin-4-alpha-carbinolamine dehydratase [Pseudomicrostroma glucosiphilum]
MSPSALASGKCEPCKKGSPKLSQEAIEGHYEELGGTQSADFSQRLILESPITIPYANSLLKSYRFKNFRTALAFTNSVGVLAEEQKHHPRLITEWGSVEVGWWTHAIGGLHTNDFVMAAKTDEIAQEAEGRK